MDSLQEAFIHPPEPCEACFIMDERALFDVLWTVQQKHLNINNPCSPASPQPFPHLFLFLFALSLQINAKTICIMNFLLAIILITFPVLHKNSDLTCDLALFPYHFLRIWL